MDLPAIASNIATACTMAKGMIDIRDGQKLAAVQVDLTERLLKAQAHVAELLGVLTEKTMLAAELQERLSKLERDQLEHLRYELAEVSSGGALAYRLKPGSALTERSDEPEHFLCQRCLDIRGAKSILIKGDGMGIVHFTCSECKATIS